MTITVGPEVRLSLAHFLGTHASCRFFWFKKQASVDARALLTFYSAYLEAEVCVIGCSVHFVTEKGLERFCDIEEGRAA